jgi:hypothetical protein
VVLFIILNVVQINGIRFMPVTGVDATVKVDWVRSEISVRGSSSVQAVQ